MRWIVRGVAALALLLLLAAGVLHWWVLPRIDHFRPRLEQLASQALAAPVRIGALHAQADGLLPAIALQDVQVQDTQGRAALAVPRVLVAFSVLSLARGGLEQLVIDGADLELRRTLDGRLLVAGLDVSGDGSSSQDTAAADWFFAQPEFILQNGRLRWVDEGRPHAPPVQLNQVQLVVRNGRGHHQMRLDATPPPSWGAPFTLVGRFRQPFFSSPGYWREWSGQLYADFQRVDVSQLHHHADLMADLGADLYSGHGALRAWADIQKGRLDGITADLALAGVSVRLAPELAPLAFQRLGGRLRWQDASADRPLEVATENLHFIDADGLRWPGGNLQLSLRDASHGTSAGGRLSGTQLDLGALSHIAQRLPLPPEVHQRLAAHAVQGRLTRLEAHWQGPLQTPHDWGVQAHIEGLHTAAVPAPPRPDGTPVEGLPGIEGAQLSLQANPKGGQATLDIRQGALTLPGVFEQPRLPFDELHAQASWRVQGQALQADITQLTLRNADTHGSLSAQWRSYADKQGAERFPGTLDLSGTLQQADAARIWRYLPLAVAADARRYVQEAIKKGQARDVQVRVKGDLRHIGLRRPPPGTEFRFAGAVHDITLAYVPPRLQPAGQKPWPAFEGLNAQLTLEHASLAVDKASTRVQGHPGWVFDPVQVRIADLGDTTVAVQASGKGPLPAALGIINHSPLDTITNQALARAQASGPATLALKLNLPVNRINDSTVDGLLTLHGSNSLRITPDTPQLTQASGGVAFDHKGFYLRNVQAQALGGPIHLSGGSLPAAEVPPGAPATRLQARGSASAEGLRSATAWSPLPELAASASGSAAYEVEVGLRAGEPDLRVTSDLRGLAFDWPAPFNKPADAAWPLRYESGPQPGDARRQHIRVSLADRLELGYQRDTASGRVLRGAIVAGAGALPRWQWPERDGVVSAHVSAPRLHAMQWLGALGQLGGEATADAAPSDFLPTTWRLQADVLQTDGRDIHAVRANGSRSGRTWRGQLQARELAGQFSYDEGPPNIPGSLQARLRHLHLPATDAPAGDVLAAADPAMELPALDVQADSFELGGKTLGRLQVKARHSRQNGLQRWELQSLHLNSPDADLSARGHWLGARGSAGQTLLDFELALQDAGRLLTRLGQPDALARGRGQMLGTLRWDGAPFVPHYPSMSGQLALDVGAGQFLKADAGAAKLLGVLSLQALPRRLSLDFRDVFSSGFAFDFIRGEVQVEKGKARTDNLEMKGANAAVLLQGQADLVHETQDLRVLVVPNIDAGAAALAAAAINPALGLGTFVAQLVLKGAINRAATRQFHIGGSWSQPEVTPIKQNTAEATTPAPAASAASAPASASAPAATPAASAASATSTLWPPASAASESAAP